MTSKDTEKTEEFRMLPLSDRLDLLKQAKRMNNMAAPVNTVDKFARHDLENELKRKKQMLQTLDINGETRQQLKSQISDLKTALKNLSLKETTIDSEEPKLLKTNSDKTYQRPKQLNKSADENTSHIHKLSSHEAHQKRSTVASQKNSSPSSQKKSTTASQEKPKPASNTNSLPFTKTTEKPAQPPAKATTSSMQSGHISKEALSLPNHRTMLHKPLSQQHFKPMTNVTQFGSKNVITFPQTNQIQTTLAFKPTKANHQNVVPTQHFREIAPSTVVRGTQNPLPAMQQQQHRLPATSTLQQNRTVQYIPANKLTVHQMQQLFAARPEYKTFYGGRMTEKRIEVVQSATTKAIEKLHSALQSCPSEKDELSDPPNILVPLLPHQRQALAWMIWREKQHPAGGILADDMGLGKTLTILSLILKRRELNSVDEETEAIEEGLIKSKCNLIICPASIVKQWEKEFERRIRRKTLRLEMYHGPNREKDMKKLAANDVVITSYETVRTEHSKKETTEGKYNKNNIFSIIWESVTLDEAHNIKNWKSKTAAAACALRSRIRWVATGTPVHNDLLDMFSLLRFMRCSPFDEYKVWKHWVDNKSDANQTRLKTIVRGLMLRRTKAQKGADGEKIVDLPNRETHLHKIKLSSDEQRVYNQIFEISKASLKNYLKQQEEKKNYDGASDEQKSSTNRQPTLRAADFLVLLLRLRQSCCHLSLIKKQDSEPKNELDDTDDLVAQMEKLTVNEAKTAITEGVPIKTIIEAIPEDTPYFKIATASSKIELLLKKLDEIHSPGIKGVKSIVVSQWTSLLNIIEIHLKSRGYKCHVITGEVTQQKRAVAIEDFNTNPDGNPIMLLSLRAGGVGLNLIGGSHLFIFDLHWNPQLESQACDRIYRVGQTRDVHIHKFLCENTIEDKISLLQQRKLQLASNVLSGSKVSANRLTLDDIKVIFGIKH